MKEYKIRPLLPSDQIFLWEMLYQSLYVPVGGAPFEWRVLNQPEIAQYVKQWGRTNDNGFVAVDDHDRLSDDYFSHEQIELWGTDGFWNLPHHPRTEYYRARTEDLGEGRKFFEFLIPMFPANWLKADECNAYEISIGSGRQPSALALSVFDIKQPSEPTGNEHWCLAHYLLDGHHKMYAASVTGKSITLLSFLSLGESIATEENLRHLIDY